MSVILRVESVWMSMLLLSAMPASAGNWPNFRGPNFDGSNTETNLPTRITKNDHVQWKAELPGSGSSTPAVWGNSVFMTATDPKNKAVAAIKIDIHSGKIEWSHPFAEGMARNRRSNFAGPSPTTDGSIAIFMSGNGELACFDFAGKKLWQRNLQTDHGQFSIKWTYSSSPVLFDGLLYIQVLQRNESIDGVIPGRSSFLLALDPQTGKEKWKQIRQARAVRESLEAYSSPIPCQFHGHKEILVSGADCMTGHDPATGRELWRWGTWNRRRHPDWRIVSSPVYGDGSIVGCAPKGEPVFTLHAGETGTVKIKEYKWSIEKSNVSCDITTPLYYGEFFYFLNGRKKVLSCVRPFNGEVLWSKFIPARAKIEASPSGADGKIFVMSHTGEVLIFRAGPRYQLLHSTVLGSDPEAKNRATIVPAKGRLFIRLSNELWCLD